MDIIYFIHVLYYLYHVFWTDGLVLPYKTTCVDNCTSIWKRSYSNNIDIYNVSLQYTKSNKDNKLNTAFVFKYMPFVCLET